jgi:molecular chaperone Hsp33
MSKIISAISRDGGAVCHVIDSTDIAARAEHLHRTSATVTAALGQAADRGLPDWLPMKGRKKTPSPCTSRAAVLSAA